MRQAKRSIEFLSAAAVLVLVVGVAATTAVVYSRLADALVKKTREAIAERVKAVASSLDDVFSLAADEAMYLMATAERNGEGDEDSLGEQLGKVQSGLVGCSAAWILPRGGKIVTARGTSQYLVSSRSWWQSYAEPGASGRIEGAGSAASLGVRGNIGFIAQPFRDSAGIGSILPLIVSHYSGMELTATAFFEINISVILDEKMKASGGYGDPENPLELSFYDFSGLLVETTRNLPLVRERTFERSDVPENGKVLRDELYDYLFPGEKTIEARHRDDRIGLVCVGRVPAAFVMRDVRNAAANVVAIGLTAIVAVLVLGILLLQAFKRARGFEELQLMARFEALQARINPHFLFNTLDSMIGVVEEGDSETLMRMLKAISSMLHATVRRGAGIVGLFEELDYVRSCLAIQEVRYRGNFSWSIEVDDGSLSTPVCRFSVQPMVENCFTHGVHEGRAGMRIRISVRRDGGSTIIQVEDDGPGCPPETLKTLERSFVSGQNLTGREGGLYNAHERTRMAFGSGFGLEIAGSSGEKTHGFYIRLRVPARGGEKAAAAGARC